MIFLSLVNQSSVNCGCGSNYCIQGKQVKQKDCDAKGCCFVKFYTQGSDNIGSCYYNADGS